MEAQINSMSEETAGRLAEAFDGMRKSAIDNLGSQEKMMKSLIKQGHLLLQTFVAEYALKHAKGNFFTKWYYKRQLKKYTERLRIFETEILPEYNAMQ